MARFTQKILQSEVTSEEVFLNRRKFLGLGAGALAVGAAFDAHALFGLGGANEIPLNWKEDPSVSLYPVPRNPSFNMFLDEVTEEDEAARYNNFYEFGSHKEIFQAAQDLKIRPWTIEVNGEVGKPKIWDIDELLSSMELEERIYRHRCVEAWSMVVPWSGFALRQLMEKSDILSSAKYVKFTSFMDPETAPGQRQSWYPWPYVEGLTIEEAAHDLTFMVTGVYGHPLPKQHGAPLRLATPWKYGFKSSKSINKIEFTKERPVSFWEEIQPKEYGFWANVNPGVPHPRWPQNMERVLGKDTYRPTEMFNGYGEMVAGLYTNLDDQSLYR